MKTQNIIALIVGISAAVSLTLFLILGGPSSAAVGPAYGVSGGGGGTGTGFPGGFEVIGVDSSTSTQTETISSADIAVDLKFFVIKDESANAGTFNITVDTEGAQKIDGVDSVVITVNSGVINLYSRGGDLYSW